MASALSVCHTMLVEQINQCTTWERYRTNRQRLGVMRLLEEAIEGIIIAQSNVDVWAYIKQAVNEKVQRDSAAMATSEVAVAK